MSLGSTDDGSVTRPVRLLDDPRVIRALAHPIRLQLRSLIGRAGRITAADASRELDISHALASHHLRQLAKYGFVRQVEGADNRERPWELVDTSYRVDEVGDDPDGTGAAAVLERVMAEDALAGLADWQRRRSAWTQGWREHSGISRGAVYLTEDELADLVDAIGDRILDYVNKRPIDDVSTRPSGSRAVDFTLFVTPHEPTEMER